MKFSRYHVLALAVMASFQHTAFAASQNYQMNAAPLSSTIAQIARQNGVSISADSALLQGKTAPAIHGNFSTDQAFELALNNSGLQLIKNADGTVYSLKKRSALVQLNTNSDNKSSLSSENNDNLNTIIANNEAVQLPLLTVKAEQDSIYDQPHSISVISREQMDNRPTRHAADMLEQSAGVYSSVSQQDPALSINIRGIQDFGRVNMNIDGMRQNFQKSGHGERNGQMYVDSELLSNVTLEKGATSGMGGAGAFGGIATFNTVNASDFLNEENKNFGGQIRVATGNNATKFIGSAIVAAQHDNVDVLVGISERRLGDYKAGDKGKISGIRTATGVPEMTAGYENSLRGGTITDSNYEMSSYLAKIGWNIDDGQRLQFSYLQTRTATPNAGIITQISSNPYALGWKSIGFSDVVAQSTALDYSLKPQGQNWLDLKAKLYYVNTKDHTDTYATNTAGTDGYLTRTQMETYGLQLQNTSSFLSTPQQSFTANYGLDVFYDKSISDSTLASMNGVTPNGNRSMASAFANLTYKYDDWLRIDGGLRYDYYHLRGTTAMTIFDFPYTVDNPCTQRSAANCSVSYIKTWNVDDQQGKVSPTVAIAIKPGGSWLELFANYGQAYRPPAITETLTTGSAHSSSVQYPNPFLLAERSNAWEAGTNFQFSGLISERDRLQGKISYFDTRIDNYINFEIGRVKPGLYAPSSGNAAYVNNLVNTKFRGIEYQVNYDADIFYADLTYTRMIGKNDFCSKPAWLGGVITYAGSSRNYYAAPIESWDTFVSCNYGSVFGSAANAPSDRGSLTLGGRAFDHKLDFGTVIRYNKGYQDDSVINSQGSVGAYYIADWPQYTLFDIYAHYQMNKNLKISASIANLTNRAYIVSYGDSLSYTLGRGRTFQAGLEYRF